MKKNIFKLGAVAVAMTLGLSSCENFLNAPTIDSYSAGSFYQNDDQLEQGVNYLYNSPWYDVIRPYLGVGEVMSGNMYMGTDMGTSGYGPYLYWSCDGSLQTIQDLSYSLWSVNAHCNTVITNILSASSPEVTVAKKKQCIGEALTWKAFTYFMLVRCYDEVPIVHDNGQLLNEKDEEGNPMFSRVKKADRASLYDYIIMTLEKAMTLLPKNESPATNGRIDYYTAEALLAKVYLTKAGASGTLNTDDLKMASLHADSVIVFSGRHLMPNYEDIFRGENNISEESLLAWRWKCPTTNWTMQNGLQADLAPNGFDEWATWGGWNGISTDLQEAFGVTAVDDPNTRAVKDQDVRRHGTYMLAGDTYSYFWTDHSEGFDVLKFLYCAPEDNYRLGGGIGGPGVGVYGGGAFMVKHLFGNNADHIRAFGYAPDRNMSSSLATHLLRLSDVYLIYAEAEVLQGNAGGKALDRFNEVRTRAHAPAKTAITFEDIWKERRLEFACEGDRWYDFVRVAYYNKAFAVAELNGQKRNTYWGLDEVWKPFYESGNTVWNYEQMLADGKCGYDETPFPTFPEGAFRLPVPTDDVATNPNLATSVPGEHVDVRANYSYDYIKF